MAQRRKSKDKIVPRNLPSTSDSKSSKKIARQAAYRGTSAKHTGSTKYAGTAKRDNSAHQTSSTKHGAAAKRSTSLKRTTSTKRAPSGGSLIEGRHATEEALAAGVPILRAYVASSASHDARMDVLVGELDYAGIPIEYVSRDKLESISSHGAHQGIVAETKPFSYTPLTSIIEAAPRDNALVIVLDHITDEGNLGAICRSAEVAGASGVVIARARCARIGTGAYKTSAGAVLRLPIAQVSNLASALDDLKAAGFWVAGATEHAEQLAWDAPLMGKLALVMGSEDEGISRLLLEKCDFTCKLPQKGQIESLNVAQATSVLAYEWLRNISTAGPKELQ